jgi:hypothetical protein
MGIHFNTIAEINAVHVPSKGVEALNDLITGRIDYYFGSQHGALPHILVGGQLFGPRLTIIQYMPILATASANAPNSTGFTT